MERNQRWTVFKNQYPSCRDRRWFVLCPDPSECRCKRYDTHAEAIAFADLVARRDV